MTNDESRLMIARIDRLERRLRVLGGMTNVLALVATSALTLPSAAAQRQTPQVVRARGLVISSFSIFPKERC